MFVFLSILASIIPLVIYLTLLWLAGKNKNFIKTVLLFFLFGGFGAVILSIIISAVFVHFVNVFVINPIHIQTIKSLTIAPIIEELTKGCFLFFLIKNKDIENLTDGLFYGGTIGLGFSVIENLFYFLSYSSTLQEWIYVLNIRTLFLSVMHFITTFVFGAFLLYYIYNNRKQKLLIVVLGLLSATFIHSLWNLVSGDEITILRGILFLFLYIILFVLTFVVILHTQKKLIYIEMREESNNNLIPYEHLEIFKNGKQNSIGWIDEGIKRKYLALITKLSLKKINLGCIKRQNMNSTLSEIEEIRDSIKTFLNR